MGWGVGEEVDGGGGGEGGNEFCEVTRRWKGSWYLWTRWARSIQLCGERSQPRYAR